MPQHIFPSPLPTPRSLPLDAMRVSLVCLVLLHHSVMAYLPEAPPIAQSLIALPRWWQAFPIVDPAKWSGFSLLVAFNDTFFMAALFLLSGLFVWSSLRRKGASIFLRERTRKLGAAFLFATLVISPLAYSATFRQISAAHPSTGFWAQWFHLGTWPAGPAWFLWLLLAFDLIAAAVFHLIPQPAESLAARLKAIHPSTLFLALAAISAILFVPMALHFGPMSWSSFGPFSVQTSRIFHYMAYFSTGVFLGAAGTEIPIFQSTGALARRWWRWLLASLFAFLLMVGLALIAMQQHPQSILWGSATSFAFCLSCAASTFAVLAICLRMGKGAGRTWKLLGESAFGIYIVHYAVVAWLQYWLLPIHIPAIAKAAIVASGALLISLGITLAWKYLLRAGLHLQSSAATI